MEKIIILGSGCAGLTAAIYAARGNLSPLVIEGTQPGGQLTTTTEVENFPGFPEGIDGYEFMSKLRKQAERFGARFTSDVIENVDFSDENKKLFSKTNTYESKTVIIATGAAPRLLDIPGEKEMFGGKGVTTCATCDGAFYRGMEVVVIGGGDTACEEALFLTNFCTQVTIIHRRDELRASKIMAQRVLKHPKIKLQWNSIVKEVLPDENGEAKGVLLEDTESGESSELACKGVFLAIGHIPNTSFVKNVLPLDDLGYIIPQDKGTVLTEIPGVYTAGDCSDHVYRQAITAAGMGAQSAIEAERWIAHHSD